MESKRILILLWVIICTTQMPQHGEYDQKNEKWFCNKWIDKKRWLEIHGYSPIFTNIGLNEDEVIDSS